MSRALSRLLRTWATGIVLSLLVLLFLLHFFVIYKCAVNIPYLDDWGMFRDDHPAALSANWLFDWSSMQNSRSDHIIATTKLFVWLQYHLNGWNYTFSLLLNFVIYGFFVTWIVWFARKVTPNIPSWVTCAFMIFFLSPIDWFNHFMATQSCYRFYLLFFFVSTYFLFSASQRWLDISIGSVMSILSIYSLASGVGSCLILLLAFCLFKGMRGYSRNGTRDRTREFLQLLVAVVLIGGALLIWIARYVKPPQYPPMAFPNTLIFWRVFLNFVSLGFGIETLSSAWGAICFLIVVVPICAVVLRQKGKLTNGEWTSFVMVAGILGSVAEITLGRAGFGVAWSKTGRFVELIMPLIPLSMISWAVLLQRRRRLQAGVLAGLFFFLLVAFSNNWDFSVYRAEGANRMEGERCVKAYYKGTGDGRCPTIYVDYFDPPLTTRLEVAKKLDASFYREMREEIERERQTTVSPK